MRLASSFFASVTLHALALAYPVSFLEPKQLNLIHVTILPDEDESTIRSTGAQSSGGPTRSLDSKLPTQTSFVKRRGAAVSSKLETEPTPQSPPSATTADELQSLTTTLNFLPPSASERQTEAPIGHFLAENGTADGGGNNFGASRGDGNGSAATGGSLGQGSDGSGRGGNFTQARYRETPKPKYPESARQSGREGTVLLRVLVDDEGRAKSVEINKSSGDDALDRAAREAIQRWRFIPARNGEKAVASWIRIPVDFRIADTNSR